jgi:hypothetical protein
MVRKHLSVHVELTRYDDSHTVGWVVLTEDSDGQFSWWADGVAPLRPGYPVRAGFSRLTAELLSSIIQELELLDF